MSQYTRDYVSDQIFKKVPALGEIGNAESILLGCLFTETIEKILEEAKLQAQTEKTRRIKPEHLREASEIVLG